MINRSNNDHFFPIFRSLLNCDEFTIPCEPYEGIIGKVLSSLQWIDPTDTDWYNSKLNSPPGRVIDLMSGSGRLAFLASRKGHRVTAIDNSPDIIALNRIAGQGIDFILGDVQKSESVPDKRAADIVTCSGKSISLLSTSERNLLYSSVRSALRRGGRFLGDAYSQFTVESTTNHVLPLNSSAGRLLWSQAQTYPISSTMITNFLLEPNGSIGYPQYRILSYQRHWGITPCVLSEELKRHGLEVEDIVEEVTPGELPLDYYRFIARAL